jgi:predicted nuclease with TOPRIM domain
MEENNHSFERANHELEEEGKRQSNNYESLLQRYNEIAKELAAAKERELAASAAKKPATFSVSRVEISPSKRNGSENDGKFTTHV